MRPFRSLGILIALALLAAACGGGSDQTATERDLQVNLADDLTPAEISGVSCPEDVEVAAESVFRCEAEVEGQYFEVQVTIIDAQGRYEHERQHAVMHVVNTEVDLEVDASAALGFEVKTNCGDSEYLVVSVGNTFQCTLTRVDGGAQRNIEVKVANAEGVIEWSLLTVEG
jgi:hypothetical protein